MKRRPPILPPDPPEPSPQGEETQQELEAKLWASARRHERQVVVVIFLILLLITAYFAALNAYVLRETKPLPYTLDFQLPEELKATARYSISMDWHPLVGTPQPSRPILTIDGEQIPEVRDKSKSLSSVDLTRSHEIRISVPGKTSAGKHSGRLVLVQTAGSIDLPDELTSPVTVAVSAGFWKSWFILRNWGIMLLAVLALLYIFCLLKFPAPSGYLVLVDPKRGFFPVGVVRLRKPILSIIFPWTRSTISLKSVWKRARPRIKMRHNAELLFLLPTLPVLILATRRAARRFGKLGGTDILSEDIATGTYIPPGRQDVMFSHHSYRYARGAEDDFIAFAYQKSRPVTSPN